MKRNFLLLIILLSSIFSSFSAIPDSETLHYLVSYKWGLIHKDAAKATLSVKQTGNDYRLILTAKSLPWVDKIFMVRDTLISTVSRDNFRVKKYVKTSHEGDHYSKDIVNFTYSGSVVKGTTTRYRSKKGDKSVAPEKSGSIITASGPTFDMLSVFYYLRTLDFATFKKNQTVNVNIFSGKHSEKLTIRYIGKEIIKLRDKSKREAYKISFAFTRDGKTKSSDDMTAWVSADSKIIPLYLLGKLPLGEMRVYLLN